MQWHFSPSSHKHPALIVSRLLCSAPALSPGAANGSVITCRATAPPLPATYGEASPANGAAERRSEKSGAAVVGRRDERRGFRQSGVKN